MAIPDQPFGFVAGRWVLSLADTPMDADRAPDYKPLYPGSVVFSNKLSHRVVADGSGTVGIVKTRIEAKLNEDGKLIDAEEHEFVALPVGVYSVTFSFGQYSWPSFDVEVKAEHTLNTPLWLPSNSPVPSGPGIIHVVKEEDRIRAEAARIAAEAAAAQAELLLAEQEAIAGLTGEDDAVAHLLNDPDTRTYRATSRLLGTYPPPPGFRLDTLPMPRIGIDSFGQIQSNLDIDALRPPEGVTYYTSPTAPNSGSGLTPETPLRLANILTGKEDVGTIIFADGTYFRNNSPTGLGTAIMTKSINWLAADGARPILTSFERHSALTWTHVQDGIYSATRSATHTVMDTRTLTEWGDYTEYEKKTGLGDITGPGQWAIDGSTVYVWSIDDIDLSTDKTHIMLAVSQYDLGIIAGSGTTQYVRGLTLMGNVSNNGGISATEGGITIAVDCAVKHSLQNGFWTKHGGHLIAVDCVATSNGLDGFNYHNVMSAGGEFVEIGCVSHHNGVHADVTNSNATSAHEAVRGIRVDGTYHSTRGPVVADVHQAQTWNVDCEAGDPLISAVAWLADATGYTESEATIWVEDSTAYGARTGLQGSNGGRVRYRNVQVTDNDSDMAGDVELFI